MISERQRHLHQSRSWDNDREDKLSKVKPLSRHQSNSLGDLSRNSAERVFIAKVIDETPSVKLRNKKKRDINRHIEHRQSAHVTSSRSTPPSTREYRFPNCRVKDQRRERPMSLDITNSCYSERGQQEAGGAKQTAELLNPAASEKLPLKS